MKSSPDLLHIVRNSVLHDSRVLKETRSLQGSSLFGRIEISGFMEPGHLSFETLPDGRAIWRASLATRPLPKDLLNQSIKYTEWYYRVVRRYRNAPLKVIHCHDLGPLPIAASLKALTGAKLIYDAHELETEMAGYSGLRKWLAKYFEQHLIKSVDALITVSPSIKDWYADRYPDLDIFLVRNVPDKPTNQIESQPLRQKLQVPDKALLFIYLGGLQKGRGIERILEAFQHDGVMHHVLFMGTGILENTVKTSGCQRIHYRLPVAPEDVLSYASGADIGLCMYEDTCLNHRFCLPNKLFETLLSGTPVLASDLPDQARIVRHYHGGWVVPNRTEALIDFLIHLDVYAARILKQSLPSKIAGLEWRQEASEMLKLYKSLLSSNLSPLSLN